MLTYRTNLAARGTPRPFAPAPDEDLRQRNRIGRPPQDREDKDWNYTAPILLEVERWMKHRGMAASRFGMLALGDPKLVFQLRAGRDPSSKIVARIRAFMEGVGDHGE